ncbi:MAG: glycosyltransferase [Alphaproteobacteria bacterium]|nr:glycosyltransferase [Alphaproteobacteria bacterium]
MLKKLLILPSWYIQPEDRINGSFFQEQARLVSNHFDVKVLFFRFSGQPSIRAFFREPVKAGLAWLQFILKGRSRTVLPDDEVFTNPSLIEYETRIIGITQRRRYQKRLKAYLEALSELMVAGWRPDLIHAHSVYLGGLVAQNIKQVYGIPYVITEHKPFVLCNYPDYTREDIKSAFENADIALSLGYEMVRQLGMNGIEIQPILVYNLVDELIFNKICTVYEPGKPLRIISVGSASFYKDHRTLLRACIELKIRGIPISLTLIGLKIWGDLYEKTVDFINDNNLQDIVTVVDCVDRLELCQYLSSHNIFLVTSVFETFCVSIIEALACGLPVITTNHGGGSVELINKSTGAVVPVRDYHAIADRIVEVYNGKVRFEPQTIRDYVVSICGNEAFKKRLIGYYNYAIEQFKYKINLSQN